RGEARLKTRPGPARPPHAPGLPRTPRRLPLPERRDLRRPVGRRRRGRRACRGPAAAAAERTPGRPRGGGPRGQRADEPPAAPGAQPHAPGVRVLRHLQPPAQQPRRWGPARGRPGRGASWRQGAGRAGAPAALRPRRPRAGGLGRAPARPREVRGRVAARLLAWPGLRGRERRRAVSQRLRQARPPCQRISAAAQQR
ncbi:unnamed protein product, partial [Prorocentrum cordatum]